MTEIDEFKLSVFTERLPSLIELGDDLQRSRWLVRFEAPVAVATCSTISKALNDWSRGEIERLYGASHNRTAIHRACPSVRIIRVDELRHFVEIVLAGPGREIAHSFLISNYGVLNELHQLYPLDELQGLPPSFWYFLKPDFRVGPPKATVLLQRVLAARDNELAEIVRAFDAAEETCWHIDRHVIGVLDERPGSELIRAACVAALALARAWTQQRTALDASGVAISMPFVVIDDAWVAGEPGAPPPHTYVCLAKDRESLVPLRHQEATPRASSDCEIVDSLLGGREKLLRLDGTFEGGPGAWIIEPVE